MEIKKLYKLEIFPDDVRNKMVNVHDIRNIKIEESDLDNLLKIATTNPHPCPIQDIHILEWDIENKNDIDKIFTVGIKFDIQIYCWITIRKDDIPSDIPYTLVINGAYYISSPDSGYSKDCKATFRIGGASRVGLIPAEDG